MPLSELLSDYSTGSFSNLRMAWQDASAKSPGAGAGGIAITACPSTWTHYLTAFAAGHLPRMNMAVMAEIKRPAWRGPKRQPPQPEKEAQSLALLAREGIITAADARDQLEK